MIDTILKRIEAFWSRKSVDYAILLTSGWGWGKTYYIQHTVKDYFYNLYPPKSRSKRGRYTYVSVGGLGEANEVKQRLIFAVVGNGTVKVSKKVASGITHFVNLISDGKISIPEDAFSAALDTWFSSSVKRVKYKDCIVIDDIERYKGDIDELFATIHNSFACKGFHVIYLGNEEELAMGCDKNQEAYLRCREKYIRYTIAFRGPVLEVMDSIVKNEGPGTAFSALWNQEEVRDEIASWIKRYDVLKNIRIILACIDNYNCFIGEPGKYSIVDYGADLFLVFLFHTAYVFSEKGMYFSSSKEHGLDEGFRKFAEAELNMVVSGSAMSYSAKVDNFSYDDFWHVRDVVCRFIVDGYLWQDIIDGFLQGNYPKVSTGDRVFMQLSGPETMETSVFEEAFESVSKIIEAKSISYSQLVPMEAWLIRAKEVYPTYDCDVLIEKLISCARGYDLSGKTEYLSLSCSGGNLVEEGKYAPVTQAVFDERKVLEKANEREEFRTRLMNLNMGISDGGFVHGLFANIYRYDMYDEISNLNNKALARIEIYVHHCIANDIHVDGVAGFRNEIGKLMDTEDNQLQKSRYAYTYKLLGDLISSEEQE